jgi:hypothetical protein
MLFAVPVTQMVEKVAQYLPQHPTTFSRAFNSLTQMVEKVA